MEMKKLMNEWRSYIKENILTYHRVILNEIQELSEEEMAKHQFPLSEEELRQLKAWGELEGDPVFLGSGTRGVAWQFGDKVLKITNDADEVSAALNIQGKENPHVYKIYKAARRDARFRDKDEPARKYVIVCELVGNANSKDRFPDKDMQEMITFLFNSRNRYKYMWVDNFEEIMNKVKQALPSLEEILKLPQDRDGDKHKLEKIAKAVGLSAKEQEAFVLAWTGANGWYGSCLTTPEKALACAEKSKFDYVDQVCQGLTFLFQNNIEFLDLKTTNVMNDDSRLVIIDIGNSTVYNSPQIPDVK